MDYHRFASIYDQLMEHAPYEEWTNFTDHLIHLHPKNVKTIVDLGCGTGEITVRLATLGYEVTGVDLSSDMLTVATKKAEHANVGINWIQQDIRKLEGFSDIDVFVSYCDVLNYITEQEDLMSVFNRVYESLRPDGLFIFDIHSIHYVQRHLVDTTFADVTEQLAYIWECEQGDLQGEMYHHLTFFQKEAEKYIRFDELHHQQTYETKVYETLLKKSGFSKIQFYGDFLFENNFSEKNSDRIFIVAEK